MQNNNIISFKKDVVKVSKFKNPDNQSNKVFIFILFIVFLINPFVGLTLLLIVMLLTNIKSDNLDRLLFFFITGFSCFLQLHRINNQLLPSDWYNDGYLGIYESVPHSSFFNFFISSYKEPGWNALNYIGYYITGGNYAIFINGLAIFTICITCTSIYQYWKITKTESITLIASLAVFVWFSEYLENLNNLLRQFLALSLVVYAYTAKITKKKHYWWLFLVAISLHTFTIIFVSAFYVKPFYEIIKGKRLLQLAFLIMVISILISQIAILKSVLGGVDAVAYGFDRVAGASDPNDQNFLNSNSVYLTSFLVIGMCLAINYVFRNKWMSPYYVNVLLILMFICCVLVKLAPEIMSRLYVSRFYIFPFVLPYFLLNKRVIHSMYMYGIIIFFFYRFLLKFDMLRGGHFFPPIDEIITHSVFSLIF